MKVILVHGDHIEKSYERLTKFTNVAKKRGWRVERISAANGVSLPEILTSTSLFDEERLFIVENIAKASKKHLEWLKKKAKKLPGNLIIFQEGNLTRGVKKNLPKPDKEEIYEYPKLIYKFLESFYPKNAESCLKLLNSLKDRHAPEYIIAILSFHLRDVLIAKLDAQKLDYQTWRVSKLRKQADLYRVETLNQVITFLSSIDYLSKTTSQSIYDSLDLLIVTQLE